MITTVSGVIPFKMRSESCRYEVASLTRISCSRVIPHAVARFVFNVFFSVKPEQPPYVSREER